MFQDQSILADAPIDLAGVESEVQIVKSEDVAVSVIKDLHLTEVPERDAPAANLREYCGKVSVHVSGSPWSYSLHHIACSS